MAGGDARKKAADPHALTNLHNPENIIKQVKLTGENYEEWARAMRTVLRAKRKYGFIDGTVKKLKNSAPKIDDWWNVNAMLVVWIFNSIEPTLRSTITHMEEAKHL